MSELDHVYIYNAINFYESSGFQAGSRLARAELADLRKRVAELEASRAELMAELSAYGNADAPNCESIVTPNNCRHCQRAAWQMREAAASIAVDYQGKFYDTQTQREIAKAINALPLPACDGCNPLATE